MRYDLVQYGLRPLVKREFHLNDPGNECGGEQFQSLDRVTITAPNCIGHGLQQRWLWSCPRFCHPTSKWIEIAETQISGKRADQGCISPFAQPAGDACKGNKKIGLLLAGRRRSKHMKAISDLGLL